MHADDAAALALASLLRATTGDASWQRALRALTLHMVAGHAPDFFRRAALEDELTRSLDHLENVPAEFPLGLSRHEAMARMDALYLAHERLDGVPDTDVQSLAEYIVATSKTNLLYAWLLTELAVQIGLPRMLSGPARPFRGRSDVHDTYWLTHLFLLETRYLAVPLPQAGWEREIEDLAAGATFALDTNRIDLAAEVAMCLQVAGKHGTSEHRALIALLHRHQRLNGAVLDPAVDALRDRVPERAARLDAHSTAASLVAFAGATA